MQLRRKKNITGGRKSKHEDVHTSGVIVKSTSEQKSLYSVLFTSSKGDVM